jgi:hypothetical protein
MFFPMSSDTMLSWKAQGLNAQARREVVAELVSQVCVSLLCIQQSKLPVVDDAEERRNLSKEELELWSGLKFKCLGLASLNHTIVRQRARITFLAERDANTRFLICNPATEGGRSTSISSRSITKACCHT